MVPGMVAYVYDGDTFVGSFETYASPAGTMIQVRYKGAAVEASSNGLPPEIVARVLLGEMVRDDLVARRTSTLDKVAA